MISAGQVVREKLFESLCRHPVCVLLAEKKEAFIQDKTNICSSISGGLQF